MEKLLLTAKVGKREFVVASGFEAVKLSSESIFEAWQVDDGTWIARVKEGNEEELLEFLSAEAGEPVTAYEMLCEEVEP